MRYLVVLLLLCLTGSAFAQPAGRRKGTPPVSAPNKLLGHWHSTSLSGDAIGIAVDNVVVEFHDKHNFTATVNMTIGGPNVYTGQYHTGQKTLTLHPVSQNEIECELIFNGPQQFTVKPKGDSVTAVFARGAAPASSGGWF
ncbi:MAG: hypothetical protein ACQKBV_10945 [Puniceicoccales bacterium]